MFLSRTGDCYILCLVIINITVSSCLLSSLTCVQHQHLFSQSLRWLQQVNHQAETLPPCNVFIILQLSVTSLIRFLTETSVQIYEVCIFFRERDLAAEPGWLRVTATEPVLSSLLSSSHQLLSSWYKSHLLIYERALIACFAAISCHWY